MSQQPRSRAPSPANRPHRPRLRNQLLFVFGILVLACGAFYTALIVATQIDRIFFPDSQLRLGGAPLIKNLPLIDTKDDSDIGGGRINILVMGLDRRPIEGDAATRTDTMFVMTIDPSTHTARGLAMPRDLYVDIPTKSGNSTFKERINTAYEYGENNSYTGGGPALVKQTVGNLLGIKINYYVVIDFEGFKSVINMLGGVDVEVQQAVNDPFYSETERLGDYYPCIFDEGIHHMDGSQALCYARTRRNSSDLDRILRQQAVMFAVMDKAAQLNILSNFDNVNNLWKRYKSTVKTDVNDAQIFGFSKLAAGIDKDQLAFLTLGAAVTPYTTPEGAAVLLPSKEGVKQIVDALMSDNRLLTENASIEVQNATGVDGQAKKATEYFQSLGIVQSNLFALNAATDNRAKTEIIDFTGKRYTAERLASWMGLSKDRVRNATAADAALRNGANTDVVIILGADAKLENALAQP